ncbi:sialate O-acetylesterase [Gimesia sp.]|uniref:sialate O-acetylesterase n=1 Tax=Gimesia sp. TaxID=2024833 RepID=UPI003A8FF0C6
MIRSLCMVCSLVVFSLLVKPDFADAKTYQVYFLGGQSNMDGYGYAKDLPDDMKESVPGVMIFHANPAPDAVPVDGRGLWSGLKPGHGVGFKSDGKENTYSNRFGVELSFAKTLQELAPDANIALIKISRGGTSIAVDAAGNFGCWDPDFEKGTGKGQGINQYDHFLAGMKRALQTTDIDHDGEADTLVPAGIVWMQGESDAAYTEEIAKQYEANLKRLMDLIRATLYTDDLPVVIGRISDSGNNPEGKVWKYGEIVRAGQAAFVEKDKRAALVTSTDEYGYSDRWHYNSEGYLDLGRNFAQTLWKVPRN